MEELSIVEGPNENIYPVAVNLPEWKKLESPQATSRMDARLAFTMEDTYGSYVQGLKRRVRREDDQRVWIRRRFHPREAGWSCKDDGRGCWGRYAWETGKSLCVGDRQESTRRNTVEDQSGFGGERRRVAKVGKIGTE